MERKEVFQILNIEETKNEEEIVVAYRNLLKHNNPEENPAGFRRLREAYEAAIAFARKSEEVEETVTQEKTEVDYWIEEFDEIYNNLYLRRDEKVWRERFRHPLCEGLDTFYEVREKLLAYFMNHSNIPHRIWLICDEVFQIRQDMEELLEVFPKNYLQFVMNRLNNEEFLPYDGFVYERDIYEKNNEDEFIGNYFRLRELVEEGEEQECYQLLTWFKDSGIYHPYGKVEGLRFAMRMGQEDVVGELVKQLEEEAWKDYYIAHYVGEAYFNLGEKEKAARLWHNIWEKEKNYVPIGINLARYYMDKEDYVTANLFLEENSNAVRGNDYLENMRRTCCSHIVYDLWEKAKKEDISFDEIIQLCHKSCVIEDFEGANRAIAMAKPSNDEEKYDYHYKYAMVYRGLEENEKAEAELSLCLALLEEKKAKREKCAEEYSKVYQGLFDCEMAFEAFDKAENTLKLAIDKMQKLREFDEWKEFMRDLAQLKVKCQKYEEAVDICDHLLRNDEEYFPAYVLRQKSCYHLDKGQQVIDDFYRAKDIYAGIEQMYFYAADIFLRNGQNQDVMDIINQARECNIDFSFDLRMTELQAMRRLSDSEEENERLLQQIEQLYQEIQADEKGILQGQIYGTQAVLFEQGVLLQRLRRYEEALEKYNQVLEVQDDHYAAIYGSAWCNYNLDEPRKALELYEKVAEIYENSPGYYYEKGLCHEKMGNREVARKLFEKTLELAEVYGDACEKLGEYWQEEYEEHCHIKDFEKAIEYITREIEDEAVPYHLLVRADWYKRNMCYEEAIEDLKRALKMDEESIFLRSQLAKVYTLNNEYDKAEEYYNKVLEVMDTIEEEKRTKYYEQCIAFFRRIRKYDIAMALCKEGLKKYPDSGDTFYNEMGEIYEAQGKTREAIASYEKCTENDEILENIAHASLANGYSRELEEYYERSKKYYDDEASFYSSWGLWKMYRARRYEESIPLYLKAVELEDDQEELYERYIDCATAYILSGKEREAREQAQKAVEFQKGYLEGKGCTEEEFLYNNGKVPFRMGLKGWEEAAMGNMEAALRYFEQMLKMPKCFNCNTACCFESYLYRARCYEIMGDKEKALELYKKVIELQGIHREAKFAIEDLEQKDID